MIGKGSSSERLHPKYRPDIDGLRAIAVLFVVLYHAFPHIIPGGFVGVDIFFVISGYLISLIIFENLKNNTFNFIEFYSLRIRRIFPSLLVTLIAAFWLGWKLLSAGEFAQLGKHIASGAFFSSNLILYGESGYFDVSAESKPLLHLWSLGIEEQFYIFWPLLIMIGFKNKIKIINVVCFFCLSSFLVNVYLSGINLSADFYLPIARFWELLIGAIIACSQVRGFEIPSFLKDIISFLGASFIILAVAMLDGSKVFPGWWALAPTVGTALIIYSGSSAWLNKTLLSSKPLVWIGLISFPFYLLHWLLLSFYGIVYIEKRSDLITFWLMLSSLFLAWILYQFIEKPIRKYGKNKTTITLLFLMTIIGFVGYNTYAREGLPHRLAAINNISPNLMGYDSSVPNCSIGEPNSPILKIPAQCFSAKGSGKNTVSVFLWGDSHVANLSYGLSSQKIQDYDISLRYLTKGQCPPVSDFRPAPNIPCDQFYNFAIDEIKKYQPNTVILLADWVIYKGTDSANYLSDQKIISTIRQLKGMGVKRIILVGNFPDFEINQAKIGFELFRPNSSVRTYKRFDFQVIKADRRMEILASEMGINFISPYQLLCNQEGCLVSASQEKFIPMAYDKTHLTYQGSEYFVRNFIDKNFFR